MNAKLPDGATRIEAAKAAVADLVGKLPGDTRLAFRVYGHQSPTQAKNCQDTAIAGRLRFSLDQQVRHRCGCARHPRPGLHADHLRAEARRRGPCQGGSGVSRRGAGERRQGNLCRRPVRHRQGPGRRRCQARRAYGGPRCRRRGPLSAAMHRQRGTRHLRCSGQHGRPGRGPQQDGRGGAGAQDHRNRHRRQEGQDPHRRCAAGLS